MSLKFIEKPPFLSDTHRVSASSTFLTLYIKSVSSELKFISYKRPIAGGSTSYQAMCPNCEQWVVNKLSLIFLYKKKRVFFSKDKYFKFSGENTCSQVSLFKLGVCCSPLLSYSQQNPRWERGGGWSAGDQIQHSFFSVEKNTFFGAVFLT